MSYFCLHLLHSSKNLNYFLIRFFFYLLFYFAQKNNFYPFNLFCFKCDIFNPAILMKKINLGTRAFKLLITLQNFEKTLYLTWNQKTRFQTLVIIKNSFVKVFINSKWTQKTRELVSLIVLHFWSDILTNYQRLQFTSRNPLPLLADLKLIGAISIQKTVIYTAIITGQTEVFIWWFG